MAGRTLEGVLSTWGATPEDSMELYTDVFRLGQGFVQADGEEPGRFKTNPIILGGVGKRVHRKIMFEDTFETTLTEFQEMDWAFMSGCTYWGRKNSAEHASKLYAMVFDLDGITPDTVNNFLSGAFKADAYPIPQHIVMSGHGLHLYYVLEDPISLYPNIKTQLKDLKYALTDRIWNRYTSKEKKVQHQGINQGFRVPGSKTKIEGVRVRAWRLNQHPTCIEELNRYVPEDKRVDMAKLWPEKIVTIDEAKSLWPEWYERVVVGGAAPGQWKVKEDLYRWWIRKIATGATYGHRYFCIMMLAIFAVKCGIYDRDRVKADAMKLMPELNNINPDFPFTEEDVDSALECLDARYVRFPRHDVEMLSGIEIPPNKRNGRKQSLHLRIARANLEILNEDAGHALQGRRIGGGTKRDLIRDYRADHPDASHTEIANALGVSRPTVIKWLRGWGLGAEVPVEKDGLELVSEDRRWIINGDPAEDWWAEVDGEGRKLRGGWEYDRERGCVVMSLV